MKTRILPAARISFSLASALAALLSAQAVHAGTTWDGGGGGTTNINLNTNWDGDAVNAINGTTAAIFGTGGSTATINVAASFTGITINRNAAFTIADGAGALTVGAGGITVTLPNTTARTHTISESSLILGANQTWSVTNNTGAALLNVSSIISGAARTLTKAGTGTLTLSGANTYSGGTTIGNNTANVGTVNITNGSALGTGAVSIVSNAGNSFPAALTLNSATGITVANNFTTSGEGQGTNGIIRNVTGNNVISGTITLGSSGGSTRIQSDGGSLTLSNTIAPNTTGRFLVLSGSATGVVSGAINNGAGANTLSGLNKEGAGTWTISGATANTYSGPTTISGGVLRITKDEALGTVAAGVTQSGTSALEIDGSGGAVTVGAEALSINGGGITNLGALRNIAGNNTYGGTVTMAAQSRINSDSGTLTLNNATAAVTGAFTLVVGGAGNVTIASPMTNGVGGVNKADGAGTLTLSGLNTFTGNVSVSAGILAAGVAGNGTNSALGSVVSTRTVTVNTGGTLRFDVGNVFNNNFASAASSVPALNIAGGTVTNASPATNSALGNITLAGGTLTATVGSASGYGSWNLNGTVTSTGTSTLSSSAGVPITLSAAAGTTTTFDVQSGTLTASAALGEVTAAGDERVSSLTKIGSGTMVLSGINTYTGNTAIDVGVLSIASVDSLPGYDVDGRFSVASGATLAVQNTVSDGDISTMLGTTNFLSGANLGFDTAGGNRTYGVNLTNTAQGPLGIVKVGANTLTLTGTNTYTGGTNVTAGTLSISSTSALPNWNVDGGFSLASGASLVIPNTVSEAEVTTLLGTTNVASGASLLFDTSLGDRTYASAITNSLQGLLNIGKIGTNTLTLAGDNTHTGNTTLTSGTLNITGSLTGLAASSNLAYGGTAGNTIVNVSGSVADYKNFTGANVAGSIAVMNQTAGSTSTLGTNGQDTQWVAQNGGYGYLNITGGTFNTGRFDAVGVTGGGTAVVYVGGTGTFNNNSGDWLILPRKDGVGQLTVGPGGNLVRTAAVTANLGITMDASNAHGALNIAGGNVDTGFRPLNFGFGSAAFTGTRGFVNLAGGTLSVGSAIVQANTNAGGQYFEHFNFGGGTLKSNAAITWLPAANAAGHTITATIHGPVTNNNNANAAFNSQIGTSSNFSGGLTLDTNNFATTIAYPLSGAGGFGVTQADIGDVSLLGGNSGYIGAPAVVFSAPAAPGGVPASGYAVIDVGTGKVNGIVITNPGTYAASETPTITLTGGGGSIAPFSTSALATANSSGGLTKTGTGTLTLSGASTYTGATSVNAGTLNLTGSLTSNVTVGNNANLGGEGSTTGSLTFSGTSDLGFNPSTGGTFLTAGSVNATGASVTVAPTVPVTGTGIVVLDAAGGITGTAGGVGNNFIYTGRGSLYFNGGNTQLLIDTAPLSLAWFGDDSTNPTFWDLNTTTNWLSGGGQKFFTGDGVTFNDFAASFVVDINAAHVFPGNIVFSNNSPNTYTIQGAFGIFGGATLTKNGTGTTVLNTSNGYTGATTVNDGVLNIRNANALGSTTAGTSVVSGALEIQGGITTAAEAITLNGSGISSAGALRNISGVNTWGTAVALGSATTIGSDADTLILPSLTGAFGLTKVGAGTVNITGATAVTSTTVEAGTLYMGAQTGASTTTTLGAANAVTLNGSSNLTIRRTDTGADDLLGAIGGTGSLTLIGDNATTVSSGDYTLNNASTFSGGTTITGARVAITTSGAALGTGTITTGANGQAFVITSGLTVDNDFILGSGLGWNEAAGYLGAIRLNTTILTGDIALASNARITGAGTNTLSGVISGGFGMDFFEDTVIGTISLTGINTYTGTTTVNSMGAGSTFPNLIVGNNNALGTTAGGTIVYGTGTSNAGSQLTLADGITVTDETLTLDATVAGYRASLVTGGTATWDGNVITAGIGGFVGFYANGAGLTIGSTDTDTITGTNSLILRGTGTGTVNSTLSMVTGGITKTDAGTWTITSNNNDFTGIPVAASGILSVGSIANVGVNSALGAGSSITLGQNSATAGRLQFTGASGGSSNRSLLINNGAAGGAGVIENTVSGQTLTLSGALTVTTPANACSLTLAGAGDGVLSGGIADTPALSLIKTGAGIWTLPGVNTYTGATTVGGGTLALTTTSPSLAGGLTFGTALGSTNVGTLDLSGVAASATFGGALTVQTNSVTENFITLAAAKTLTINGGLAMSNNVDGGETRLTMTGGGDLVVNGASITVGNHASGGTNNSSEAHLNVAALDSFTATLSGNLTIQASGDNSASDASSLTLSNVANSITAAAVRVGNSSTGSAQRIWLGGGTNVIQTDLINLGAGSRDTGIIDFAGTGGSVSLRDVAGTGRVGNVNLGPQAAQATAYTTANLIDLTGNTADVAIGTFATSLGAKVAANTNDLSFDTGTLDILSINMAFAKGTGASTNRITIGGGTVRLGGSAAFSDAGTGTLTLATAGSGELIINGGTVTTTADLLKGTGTGTATVTINGGTLDMGGNDIGTLANPITLTAESGTLSNVASINGTGGLTKTTAGTLVLSGTISYVGDTTVSEGILTLSSAASPANANTANDASIVTIASTGATLNLTYTGTDLVDELFIGATQKSPGVYGKVGSASPIIGIPQITGDGTLTVANGPAGYASWILSFFPGETDPAIIGAAADPDNDGIENAVEMVIGGDPKLVMDAALLPTLELVNADPDGDTTFADYLLFTYRRSAVSELALVAASCETDSDLVGPWTPAIHAISGVVIQEDLNFTFTPAAPADTDRVRVYVPRGANTELFGRLNVKVP